MWKCNKCLNIFKTPMYNEKLNVAKCTNPDCCSTDIYSMELKSLRYNSGKLSWSQIHYKSLEPMIRVLEYGESKYHKFNWQTGLDLVEIQESMQRHLAAVMDGELYDKESGELHMGHIMSNGMFWIYHFNKNKENNNV